MSDAKKRLPVTAEKATAPRRTGPKPSAQFEGVANEIVPARGVQRRITELRVSGHLMTLDSGSFCIFHAPGSSIATEGGNGLPAVRLSLPPGKPTHPDAVRIRTFHDDGWLSGAGAAALIRVTEGPTQILVTIYQAPGQGPESAPRLQVLRLTPENPAAEGGAGSLGHAASGAPDANARVPADAEVIAHIQSTGDVGMRLGEWMGRPGSGNWIEGFAVIPPAPLGSDGIEYQAVLGRGWTSPWVDGGQFCGSRGMALPLLGIRLRLKGAGAADFDLAYSASFIDGSRVGPVAAGEACECESLAPIEAFHLTLVAKKNAAAVPLGRGPAWLSAEPLAPAPSGRAAGKARTPKRSR